ncbi:MAG: hypothetical protein SPLM_10560 [Spiroplasma phoeniceum]|uniref:hypothetical protein n=1 Tax=Spiroplasma phoeniceum TaxID=47835 RepID=UPI003133E74F
MRPKNYPWHPNRDYSGYHFKTQIVFYNEGVKLKMKVKYELYVKGNRFPPNSEHFKCNFEINTIAAAYIRLKEK